MEYVIVRATHPSWLTLMIPTEVAQMLRFDPRAHPGELAGRSVSFLARGRGIARIVPTHPAREALAVETVRGRLLATSRPGERLLFTLPTQVAQHLELRVHARGPRLRGTDDAIVWFTPAPEYYAFRAAEAAGKAWEGPPGSPFAHVYLARSFVPLPRDLGDLADVERRLEEEEWRPTVETFQRLARPRRPAV